MNILLKHITRNMKENVGRTTLIMLSLFVVSILVAIITLGILFIIMMSDASSNLASFEYQIQSTTGEYILNDVVNEAVAMVQPPSDKGRRLKIYYLTQVSTKPPTFVIFVNNKKIMHFSYVRYLENQLRKNFGLEGTTLRFIVREKGDKF